MADNMEIHHCLKCNIMIEGTEAYLQHFKECRDIQLSYIQAKLMRGDYRVAARDAAVEAQRASTRATEAVKRACNRDDQATALVETLSASDVLAEVGYAANTIVREGVKASTILAGAASAVVAKIGAITCQLGQGMSDVGTIIDILGHGAPDDINWEEAFDCDVDRMKNTFIKLGRSVAGFGDALRAHPILREIGEEIADAGEDITTSGQAVTMVGYGIAKLGECLAKGATSLGQAAEDLLARSGSSRQGLNRWGYRSLFTVGAAMGGCVGGPAGAAGGALMGVGVGVITKLTARAIADTVGYFWKKDD